MRKFPHRKRTVPLPRVRKTVGIESMWCQQKSKKNAPMFNIGALESQPLTRIFRLLSALSLVPIPRAKFLVLMLPHLLAALLDYASHRPSGMCRSGCYPSVEACQALCGSLIKSMGSGRENRARTLPNHWLTRWFRGRKSKGGRRRTPRSASLRCSSS